MIMKGVLLLIVGIIAIQAEDELTKEFRMRNYKFSSDLFHESLTYGPNNFMVSPMSVDIILALVHLGGKGNTANQISECLHLPIDISRTQLMYKRAIENNPHNETYILDIANKIFVQSGFNIKDTYVRVAKNVFHSEFENVDFTNKAAAAEEIDKWVESKTGDKVKNSMQLSYIDKQTRMALVNTIYFNGIWKNLFSNQNTQKKPFYAADKNYTVIDMMETTNHFQYSENRHLDAKFLVMPYVGNEVTMMIALPNTVDGLPKLERNLPEVLHQEVNSWENVHVQMPKVEMESDINYTPHLQALGIKDAFNYEEANFGKMLDDPFSPMIIEYLVEKTYVKFYEEGTVSTAATSVVADTPNILQQGPTIPPKEFNINHPFIFYIRDPLGVLFMGRYTK